MLTANNAFSRQRTYEQHHEISEHPYVPWFTGSLLPPSAVNAPPNHPVVAPYLGFTTTYGSYNDQWDFKADSNLYSITPYLELLFGINDHIGVDIYASFISSFKKNQSATHLQDTIVLLGFQVARDKPKTWTPDIRFIIQETFPTGNYQKLDPKKLGVDSTGFGSYQTGFNIVAQKLFPLENHFLVLKWTLAYLFPAPVHVKGLNTYGGGRGTKGKVFPGQILQLFFSGEYSITQRWAFAWDTFFEYQGKSTFSGTPGTTSSGASNHVGLGPMIQMSFSPQVEYNISQNSGLLFAVWSTMLGRNSPAFTSVVGTYYIMF